MPSGLMPAGGPSFSDPIKTNGVPGHGSKKRRNRAEVVGLSFNSLFSVRFRYIKCLILIH